MGEQHALICGNPTTIPVVDEILGTSGLGITVLAPHWILFTV
jgi:hypothetical protein